MMNSLIISQLTLVVVIAAVREDLLPPCRNFTIDGVFRIEACWKTDFVIEPIPPTFTLTYEEAAHYIDFLNSCYFRLDVFGYQCNTTSNTSSHDCPVVAVANGGLGDICFTSNMKVIGAHFLDSVFMLREAALGQLSNALEEYVALYKIAKLDEPWITPTTTIITRGKRESNILRSCYRQCNRRQSIP